MAGTRVAPGPGHDGPDDGGRDEGGGPDRGSVRRGEATEALLAAARDIALRLEAGVLRPPAALRVRAGDVAVELEWPAEACPAPPAAPGTNGHAAGPDAGDARAGPGYLRAPMVGCFYRAPAPGADPFVDVGDVVAVGQQVAVVETMKLMIPVEAELAGTVVEVLRADGDNVEHGEPLFALEPTAGA